MNQNRNLKKFQKIKIMINNNKISCPLIKNRLENLENLDLSHNIIYNDTS